jgi:hypothetical protein
MPAVVGKPGQTVMPYKPTRMQSDRIARTSDPSEHWRQI